MTELSYQEILAAMTETYQAQSGHNPDDASDIGIRLKVLAAQLADLWETAAHLEKQAFPETSTGEYLDRHAAQRGLKRKPAAAAQGILRFSRAQAAAYDIPIPAGTVCQTEGDDPVQAVTTEERTLTAGELTVDCPARAAGEGAFGNLAAGQAVVMVTPVLGITGVTNPQPFAGGEDAEEDEELRQRLLESFRSISNGTNRAYYLKEALAFEGVASAAVLPGRRGNCSVDVVVSGWGSDLSGEAIAAMQEHFDQVREIGVDLQVMAAQTLSADPGIQLAPREGADFDAVSQTVRETVETFFAGQKVGEPFLLAHLTKAVLEAEGVYNCRLTAPSQDLFPLEDQVVRLGELSITRMAVGG